MATSKITSLQQVVDKVAPLMRRQGKVSINGEGCAYRGDGGIRCFVGHLIDDEHYDDKLEGYPSSYQPVREALTSSGVATDLTAPECRGGHLDALQRLLHDNIRYTSNFVEEFDDRLAKFCVANELIYPEPVREIRTQVKEDVTEYFKLNWDLLTADAKEYGTLDLTVALSEDLDQWSFQTGDNSYTGGAYISPHWAVVTIHEDSNQGEVVEDIFWQWEEIIQC